MHFFEEFKDLSDSPEFESASLPEGAVATCRNPVCGDVVSVHATLKADRLVGFEYKVRGCWPVHSCLEFLGRKFVGRPMGELLAYRLEDFLGEVDDIPMSKRHAFSLSFRGLKGAVTEASAQLDGRAPKERV